MGVDVEMYFEADELDYGFELLSDLRIYGIEGIEPAPSYGPKGATHRCVTYQRYYGFGYERGPWGSICAALMILMQDPKIKRVWYFGDGGDDDGPELTIDEVLRISRHYMTHGQRPYRDEAYRASMKDAPDA